MLSDLQSALSARDELLATLAGVAGAARLDALPRAMRDATVSIQGWSIGEYADLHSRMAHGAAFPNVAVGVSSVAGQGFRLAVRLQDQSLQPDAISRLVTGITGEVAEVLFVGEVRAGQAVLQARQRPLEPGLSVSHVLGSTGTMGCVVEDVTTGAELLLSNNHIFANENRGSAGDEIFQPGSLDGGGTLDVAAELARFEPIVFAGNNEIDAALARCLAGACNARSADARIQFSGRVRGAAVQKGTGVRKIGRSSGYTRSAISAIGVKNIRVRFQTATATFDDQLEIGRPSPGGDFAVDGDSGSLIVDDAGDAVALLFAVTDVGTSYGNPIDKVLSTLDIRLK